MISINKLIAFTQSSFFISISSYCGILSFLISIYLSIKSSKMKSSIKTLLLTQEYNRSIADYKSVFRGYKSSILNDDIKTSLLLNDILEWIVQYERKFHLIFPLKDKIDIFFFKLYLKRNINKVDFDRICTYLSNLIGTMITKEP